MANEWPAAGHTCAFYWWGRGTGVSQAAPRVGGRRHRDLRQRVSACGFDRMMIAPSLVENLAIVTPDAVFDRYGVA